MTGFFRNMAIGAFLATSQTKQPPKPHVTPLSHHTTTSEHFAQVSEQIVHQAPFFDPALVEALQQNNIRLLVIRHGEAIHNLERLAISTLAPGIFLTEKGKQQVTDAALKLCNEKIDYMYISPVYRTLQTAEILGSELHIPHQKMIVDARLREQFFGSFENHKYLEYIAQFPNPNDVYIQGATDGESGTELFTRTHCFISDIASLYKDATVLIVTHAHNCCQINKCLTDSFEGIPMQAELKIYDFSNN
jgi:glucosyl-3-phosphoglycerate phosphatase